MEGLRYNVLATEMGWVAILVSDAGLRAVTLQPSPQEALERLGPEARQATHDPTGLLDQSWAIQRYFEGESSALDSLDLDLEKAPPFFKAAWEATRSIPPGETRTYSWIAQEAGRPRAFRAAGQAMARNRLALVIPCHRVIGSHGGLHGYGMGGLAVKAKLLDMEREFAESQSEDQGASARPEQHIRESIP